MDEVRGLKALILVGISGKAEIAPNESRFD